MRPLFRADQVGSLIRPASLLEYRKSAELYTDRTHGEEHEAISTAIAYAAQKQVELSIRPITTGEYERTSFFSGFFEHLDGMETRHVRIPEDFRPGLPTVQIFQKMGLQSLDAVVAAGPIKRTSSSYLSSWEMLKQSVPEHLWGECKVSVPSITWQHMQLAPGKAYDAKIYDSDESYLSDLAGALHAELLELYEAGLRSVQIDDPHLTYFVIDEFRQGLKDGNIDPEELLDLYIWANNKVLEGLPADMHVGVHLCRGNMPGIDGMPSGSYEMIAEKVFSNLNYKTFYLEFDDERSGSFEPLRYTPLGKNVVLGLVSTKHPDLENLSTLEGRVMEAAHVIAKAQGRTIADVLRDTLAVSPQCGFASHSSNRGVGSEERMWEKLVLVRDLARKVWGDAR